MNRANIGKLFILLSIASMCLLTSCASNSESADNQQSTSGYQEMETQTDTIGYVEHGPAKTDLDEKGNPLPYEYNGKEFVLDYSIKMGGVAEYMGFLLFVNGKPQKFTLTDEEAQYCNYIKLEENKENYDLLLKFTPTVGKKDETLLCSVVSIFNAKFKPDMTETVGYGINQSECAVKFPIHYNVDAVVSEEAYLNDLISEKKHEIKKLNPSEIENVFDLQIEEMQNKGVYNGMLIGNKKIYDNFDVSGLDEVNIKYGLTGKLNAVYKITFYMDNTPIHTTEMELKNNKVGWLNVSMDVKGLKENTSFYAIAVPASYNTSEDREQSVVKSSSILLYRK